MGREVRKVPADWQHPKDDRGRLIPMYDRSYAEDAKEFLDMANSKGLQEAIDYFGSAPEQDRYMPDWPAAERTHLMMYETCSEGTPISPAFATPEELARWLADNKASAFGHMTASYEEWLGMCRSGWAPSFVVTGGCASSGVAAVGGDQR